MDRIAIIDLGSNSIRFIVMQIGEQGSYKLINQEKKSIRLAEGMTQETRLLTEEAQERVLKCLTVYAHIIEVQKVKKVLAVATAAVRNAVNGASFLKRVHMTTGISMTIISGRAEAALGFSGVIHTIDRKDSSSSIWAEPAWKFLLSKIKSAFTPSAFPTVLLH